MNTVIKPRENKFDDKKFRSLINELKTNTKKLKNEDCEKQLSNIKEIESQLRFLKKAIQERQKNINS